VLTTIRGKILTMVLAGRSLADVVATKPTADFGAPRGSGFINGAALTEPLYNDLKARGVKR
jgi:hypothetical protein